MKIYDLRSFKPLPPVSFSSGPGFINALPRRSSTVVITSTEGLVNIVDTSNPGGGGEFYQVHILYDYMRPKLITSLAGRFFVRELRCGLSDWCLPRIRRW